MIFQKVMNKENEDIALIAKVLIRKKINAVKKLFIVIYTIIIAMTIGIMHL